MNYQIVEKPAFTAVGKTLRVSIKNGDNMRLIPEFWQQCVHDGTLDRLNGFAGKGSVFANDTLGLCLDFAPDMSEFTYMVAAEKPAGASSDGLVERSIPPATYAVFEAKGALPDSIQNLWGQIMAEFLPAGEYAHALAPDIEVYPPGDPMQPGYQCSVWVPVVKK